MVFLSTVIKRVGQSRLECVSFLFQPFHLHWRINPWRSIDCVNPMNSSHILDSIEAAEMGLLIIDSFQYSFEMSPKQNEEVCILSTCSYSCYNILWVCSDCLESPLLYIHWHHPDYPLGPAVVWSDSLLFLPPPPSLRLKMICFMIWMPLLQ